MNADIIHEIFNELKSSGVVKSQNQFSRDLLGRSSRLYSWVLATDNPPALEVMLGLYARLGDLCERAARAENTLKANKLDDLTTRLWSQIREESLMRGPHRRTKRRPLDAPHAA